jgi:hypothetical protein
VIVVGARCAGDGLSGRAPSAAAMAGYEARRDEATLADFHENLEARSAAERSRPAA